MPVPPTPAPDWSIHLPPGLDPAAIDLTGAGNLPTQWVRRWAEHPGAPSLIDINGTLVSAAELEQRTRSVALGLRGAGLAPRDRLVIAAQSSAAFVIAYVGALRAGLTVVTLNLAYTRPEITAIVADAAPAAALVDDDEKASWIREATGRDLPINDLTSPLPEARGSR